MLLLVTVSYTPGDAANGSKTCWGNMSDVRGGF